MRPALQTDIGCRGLNTQTSVYIYDVTPTTMTRFVVCASGEEYFRRPAIAPNKYNPYNTDFKPLFCSGDTLAENGSSLALDVVGFFLPAKGGVGAAVTTVSGITSTFNSLFHKDIVGAGAGTAGEMLGLTYGAGLAIGKSWAGVIPGVSTVLNVGTSARDAIATGTSYNKCMRSSKYD